jgi:hypothetical protein
VAEPKTKSTTVDVGGYIAGLENPRRRADAAVLVAMMSELSGEPPVMWGPTMIGFGRLRYTYETGHSGEMFRMGFAPRKPHLVIYSWSGFEGAAEVIGRLGKVKKSTGCLYVNKLDDIALPVLSELLERGLAHSYELHPPS